MTKSCCEQQPYLLSLYRTLFFIKEYFTLLRPGEAELAVKKTITVNVDIGKVVFVKFTMTSSSSFTAHFLRSIMRDHKIRIVISVLYIFSLHFKRNQVFKYVLFRRFCKGRNNYIRKIIPFLKCTSVLQVYCKVKKES